MTAGWLRRSSAAALAGLLGLAVLTAAPPAEAAANSYAPSIGSATGSVLTGSTASAPVVVTSGLCPAGTAVVQGFMDGPGLVGAVAIASDSAGLATINTTGIQFSNNLLQVALDNGTVLVNGSYDVAIVCDPGFGVAYLAQFDGVLHIAGGATPTAAGTTYTWDPGGSTKGTTTALTASPASPVHAGDAVTLTATVAPAGAAGTVQFVDTLGGVPANLGSPVAVSGAGTATLATTALSVGVHQLAAAFTPTDPKAYGPSSATAVPYTVLGQGQTATSTTLTAAPAAGVIRGATVTLTATVAPSSVAGTVSFAADGAALAQTAVVNGTATVTIQPTAAGTIVLTATFTPTDVTTNAGSVSNPIAYPVAEPFTEGPFLDDLVVSSANQGGGNGPASEPLQLTAAQICPAPATTATARISGPGGWALGVALPANGAFDRAGASINTDPLDTVASSAGLQFQPGRYLISVTCREPISQTATGFFLGRLWFYDATHWMNQDPAVVGIPTTTTATVLPADRAVVANKVELTALVTPSDSAGSILFEATSGTTVLTIGTAKLTAGKAVLATSTLEFGLYYVRATYVPDGTNTTRHNGSTSTESILAVTKGFPPEAVRAAALSGTAKVGATLTCSAGFKNATSTAYQWFRDRTKVAGSTAGRRLVAADAGHRIRCRALATNGAGTVYRDSPAAQVRP